MIEAVLATLIAVSNPTLGFTANPRLPGEHLQRKANTLVAVPRWGDPHYSGYAWLGNGKILVYRWDAESALRPDPLVFDEASSSLKRWDLFEKAWGKDTGLFPLFVDPSPDGRRVVLMRRPYHGGGIEVGRKFQVIDVEREQWKEIEEPNGGRLVWSADSQRLVAVDPSGKQGRPAVWTRNLEGNRPWTLASTTADLYAWPFPWGAWDTSVSATGKVTLLISPNVAGVAAVCFEFPLSPGPAGQRSSIGVSGDTRVQEIRISPDGNRVAWLLLRQQEQQNGSLLEVWTSDLRGSRSVRHAWIESGAETHVEKEWALRGMRWSPDGKRIAVRHGDKILALAVTR